MVLSCSFSRWGSFTAERSQLPYSANLQHNTTDPAALRPSSVFMTGEGRAVRRDIQLAVPPTMKPESSPNRCAA